MRKSGPPYLSRKAALRARVKYTHLMKTAKRQPSSFVMQVEFLKLRGTLTWTAWTGNFTRAKDRLLAEKVAA
jgi:hypothetical protein